jgi:hypothetical protein
MSKEPIFYSSREIAALAVVRLSDSGQLLAGAGQ